MAAPQQCSSGRELIARQRIEDVRYAAESNVSTVVPVLVGGAFVAAPRPDVAGDR